MRLSQFRLADVTVFGRDLASEIRGSRYQHSDSSVRKQLS